MPGWLFQWFYSKFDVFMENKLKMDMKLKIKSGFVTFVVNFL